MLVAFLAARLLAHLTPRDCCSKWTRTLLYFWDQPKLVRAYVKCLPTTYTQAESWRFETFVWL